MYQPDNKSVKINENKNCSMKFISSAFFGGYRRSLYFCIIIFITTSKMKRKILLSLILCVLCSTLQASKVGDGIITSATMPTKAP